MASDELRVGLLDELNGGRPFLSGVVQPLQRAHLQSGRNADRDMAARHARRGDAGEQLKGRVIRMQPHAHLADGEVAAEVVLAGKEEVVVLAAEFLIPPALIAREGGDEPGVLGQVERVPILQSREAGVPSSGFGRWDRGRRCHPSP